MTHYHRQIMKALAGRAVFNLIGLILLAAFAVGALTAFPGLAFPAALLCILSFGTAAHYHSRVLHWRDRIDSHHRVSEDFYLTSREPRL